MEKQVVDSKDLVIDQTEHFRLEVGVIDTLGEPLNGVVGYRLINKRTGVVEAEGMSEAGAIRAMHKCQEHLQNAIWDPKGDKDQKQDRIPAELLDVLPEGLEFDS